MGHLRGYTAVPPGHPFHSLPRHATPLRGLDVHGTVTYAAASIDRAIELPENRGLTLNCWCGHEPAPDEPDDLWWLGFECGHDFDLQPGNEATLHSLTPVLFDQINAFRGRAGRLHRLYRDLAFVRTEVTRLAAQLDEVRP